MWKIEVTKWSQKHLIYINSISIPGKDIGKIVSFKKYIYASRYEGVSEVGEKVE